MLRKYVGIIGVSCAIFFSGCADESTPADLGQTAGVESALVGSAPTKQVLYNFTRPLSAPNRLLLGSDGNFYGTAQEGGFYNMGALFKMAPDGTVTILHHFDGSDGAAPIGGLARDASGVVYGSASTGGSNGFGTLFSWSSAGGVSVLHHFSWTQGSAPSSVTLASDGALYGTAREGGDVGNGTLFKWKSGVGFTRLFSFNGGSNGGSPYAGVIQASDGALYGTTGEGGAFSKGTIYKWQSNALTTVASFNGTNGAFPFWGGLTQGSDGALYGTTYQGGANNRGALFKWQSATGITALHSFTYYQADGGDPHGGVVFGSDGALYGTTSNGGGLSQYGRVFRWTQAGGITGVYTFTLLEHSPQWGVVQASDGALYGGTRSGTLFKVTTGGSYTVLHQFGKAQAFSPNGRIARADDGSLRGTTNDGGTYNKGTLYSLTGSTFALLYSFDGGNGETPETGLIRGSDGAFYGTTTYGGSGCGTLYKWQDGIGFKNLHAFAQNTTGCRPMGGVIQGSDGAYYGTTNYGGTSNNGTLFKWDGALTVLHNFTYSSTGASPLYNGVIQGSDGALYGTSSDGGPNGAGTLFKWQNGALSILHSFSWNDGKGTVPSGGVVQGADGRLYGTTFLGGASDVGTLFRWSSAGGFSTVRELNGTDGQYPYLPLVLRSDNLLYGAIDTAQAQGRIFQWNPSNNAYDAAHTFAGSDGASLSAWLTTGTNGELYGTTAEGGTKGGGTIFQLSWSDQCQTNNGGCDANASCAGGTGIPTCTCNSGYSGSGTTCTDINECSTGNGGCDSHATCTNIPGSRTCACNSGYSGDGVTCTLIPPTLTSISVTPTAPSIAKGLTRQFVATGNYSDGSTQNLTTTTTWSSSNTSVATISNTVGSKGLAFGAGLGSTTITATSGSVSGTATLTVTAPNLVSIAVTPVNPSIAKGLTQQFTATGSYTDSSTQNLTTTVTWSSSAASVATISNVTGSKGLASSLAIGSTTITATSGSVSGNTSLTVTAAALVSLVVTPANPSIAKGLSQQFAATGTYTDNTTQNLTNSATWTSSVSSVASISNTVGSKGLASAVAAGTSTISATLGSVSGSTTLTVAAPALVSISIAPTNQSIAKGQTLQFFATGTYTDGSTQSISSTVTWASSATSIATVSNVSGSKGLATGAGIGSASISATLGSVSNSTTLTISAPVLSSIAITPANSSVAKGQTKQLAATGTYSDGSTQDITALANWSASPTTIATVSNINGSKGLVTGVDLGSATISAALTSIIGSTAITVTAPVLTALSVDPADESIADGTTLQFYATGVYSDFSTQDLTAQVTWSSSSGAVATISNISGSKGFATAVNPGAATISATFGAVVDSTGLTITDATLESVDIQPVDPTVAKGTTQPFMVIGLFTDDTTQDLTESATWSTSHSSVATVLNTTGSKGQVTAVNQGTATITASVGGKSDTSLVTVTNATLQSISVTPIAASIAKGTTQQFTATGTYSDASTQDLTTQVTWSSSSTTVATISNTSGSNGRATGVNGGTTNITATLGAISNTRTLTVTAVTLSFIVVAPTSPTLAKKYKLRFVATARFSDNTTQDVTALATWSSSNTLIATISNLSTTKGLATGVAAGTTTISAVYGGKTASSLLTVTNATLSSIAVTPSFESMFVGETAQFTATGTFSDGSKLDITTQCSWSSSRKKIVSISSIGVARAIKSSSLFITIKANKSKKNGTATAFVF